MTRYAKILIPFVLLSLALWSCDRNMDHEPERQITFSTIVEEMSETRGKTVTNDAGARPMLEMGVFALYGKETMKMAVDSSRAVFYFKNLKVTREKAESSLTQWTYSPTYLWPNMTDSNTKLRFVAYSPYADNTNNGLSVSTSKGAMNLIYTTPEDVTKQPDLIVSDTVASNNPDKDVSLTFNHVLSMHRFAIGDNMVPGLNITKIKFDNILTKNSYRLAKNTWGSSLTLPDSIVYGDGVAPLYTTTGTSQERSMSNILNDGLCFFLLPQKIFYSGNKYTADKDSSFIYISYVFNGISTTKKFTTVEWAKGKVYTYRLKFESGGLSFDVESGITGWESGEPTDHPVYNW